MELRAIRRNREGTNEHLMQAGKYTFVNESLLLSKDTGKLQA